MNLLFINDECYEVLLVVSFPVCWGWIMCVAHWLAFFLIVLGQQLSSVAERKLIHTQNLLVDRSIVGFGLFVGFIDSNETLNDSLRPTPLIFMNATLLSSCVVDGCSYLETLFTTEPGRHCVSSWITPAEAEQVHLGWMCRRRCHRMTWQFLRWWQIKLLFLTVNKKPVYVKWLLLTPPPPPLPPPSSVVTAPHTDWVGVLTLLLLNRTCSDGLY